jgi:hypothetical protein
MSKKIIAVSKKAPPVDNTGKWEKMSDSNNVGSGVFSNKINVALTPRELFIDFGVMLLENPNTMKHKIELVSRVILTREHALELRDILNRTLSDKE